MCSAFAECNSHLNREHGAASTQKIVSQLRNIVYFLSHHSTTYIMHGSNTIGDTKMKRTRQSEGGREPCGRVHFCTTMEWDIFGYFTRCEKIKREIMKWV